MIREKYLRNNKYSSTKADEPSEEDPEVTDRIKVIENKKKGFTKQEIAKVKFYDNLD
jgi:hypothetical protein